MQHRRNEIREISTHAPAGGATCGDNSIVTYVNAFLLTPLREGRPGVV